MLPPIRKASPPNMRFSVSAFSPPTSSRMRPARSSSKATTSFSVTATGSCPREREPLPTKFVAAVLAAGLVVHGGAITILDDRCIAQRRVRSRRLRNRCVAGGLEVVRTPDRDAGPLLPVLGGSRAAVVEGD